MITRLINFSDLVIHGDTLNYEKIFQNISSNELISHPKGFVFSLILYVFKSIGFSFKVTLFTIIIFVDIVLLKVSMKLTKGILIYFILYYFIQWNYAFLTTSVYLLRQSLALAIALSGYFLAQKRSLSIICVMLSILIHPISTIILAAYVVKRIKHNWMIILSVIFLYYIPRMLSEIELPVDLVVLNKSHYMIYKAVIIGSVVNLILKQKNETVVLLYSFFIFLLAFNSVDLIWYRIILASYFVVLPSISINIINGLRYLLVKLQST